MKYSFWFLAFLLFANFAYASDFATAKIVEDSNGLSVEIETEKGWHTYYKDPGEAGWGTEFDFTGSQDFELIDVVYPEYELHEEYGIKTNVYYDNVKFPIKAEYGDNPLVKLNIKGAVCNEICVPFEFDLEHKVTRVLEAEPDMNISLAILFTAFVAGLILNIMPCVLPVLALKVLSVVKQSGKEIAHARAGFLATAIGIIFSFIILAAGTAFLKSLGHSLGWGLHFQSPIFVGILTVIMLIFGLSLWGVFHINVPSWIGNRAPRNDSLISNFMAGVLATLLGTACTAPFLVTAVGIALAGGYTQIFVIFIVMGIGMALPYLLFAARPQLANFLPKPGKWMEFVKQFLGVMLIATALWLASVFVAQIMADTKDEWESFSEAKLEQYIGEDKTVFVDITAKWCVNCQVNKIRVLNTDEIEKYFADNEVVLLRGDMTKPRPDLLEYIKKYERYGIPFNIVYGANAKEGVLLDTLLSAEAVKAAIDKAAK